MIEKNLEVRIDLLNELIKQTENIFNSNIESLLRDLFKDIFYEFNDIKKIYWNQYTQNFNDGDPCQFIVDGLYFNNGNDVSSYLKKDKNKYAILMKHQLIFEKIHYSILESLYNDGVQVIIEFNDGDIKIETEEYYDHE